MSEAGEGGRAAELDAGQATSNPVHQHEESEKKRVFMKPLPYRPPSVNPHSQIVLEDDAVAASREQSNTLSSRPMSQSKRNLLGSESPPASFGNRAMSDSLRNLMATEIDSFEVHDRDALIADNDVAPAEAKWEDEGTVFLDQYPRADGAEDEDPYGLFDKSPGTDGEASNISASRPLPVTAPSPVTSPVATEVLRNMVYSQHLGRTKTSTGYGRKARLVNKRLSQKEQKIAERMARLGFAPDEDEWDEQSPMVYNLGEPEKYTFSTYKYPPKGSGAAGQDDPGAPGANYASRLPPSGAARTSRHIGLRPSSAKPVEIKNDDLPYSSRVAVSKSQFASRPLSAPLSRRGIRSSTGAYDVADFVSRRDLQSVMMPKVSTLSSDSKGSDPLAEMKRKMFGFVNLYEEIAEDDLEGPASDRNEDSLSERSESEQVKVQKKPKRENPKAKLDTFEVLIEGAGEGSLAYFLAHGTDTAEPEAPVEKKTRRPWRDKILKSVVMLQCAMRGHLARALVVDVREEWERTKAMRHTERKRALKKRLMNAARLWGKVKRSVSHEHFSQSEEVCMVRAEEARLVARSMLISGRTHAAVTKLKDEDVSISTAWGVLPSWVQNDLAQLRLKKTEKALFHETEKMGLKWTNVGSNNFASYAQRYIRIWSMDQAVEVMEEEDVGKVAAGLGIWLHKLGAIVESKHLPALGQSLQWIRLCGYNVARAMRYYLSTTKYLREQVGKDGFTHPDQIKVSDIREVERCGLYWLRSPHGGALTDADGRGVVVIHPPLIRSMQHSDATAVLEGPAKGLCTAERLLWRLTVFTRMLLDAVPKAQVHGVTVLVDVTDDRAAGLTYALLVRLQEFVLGTFPSLVRKVVIFGPRRNVMTGWATASRLLLPAMGAQLVYADNAQCTRFSLSAISRELGIDVVAIPSGHSCPVEDGAEDDVEVESVEQASLHPSMQSELAVLSSIRLAEFASLQTSRSGDVSSVGPSNSGDFSSVRGRSELASVRQSASTSPSGRGSSPTGRALSPRGRAASPPMRPVSPEVASRHRHTSDFASLQPHRPASSIGEFASLRRGSAESTGKGHASGSAEGASQRHPHFSQSPHFSSSLQSHRPASSIGEFASLRRGSAESTGKGPSTTSVEVSSQRRLPSSDIHLPSSDFASLQPHRPASSIGEFASLRRGSAESTGKGHASGSAEGASQRHPHFSQSPHFSSSLQSHRPASSIGEWASLRRGSAESVRSAQADANHSSREAAASEPVEPEVEEEAAEACDDVQEQVIYLEEHNFAQEALLMGDGWYGTYDTSTGQVSVTEGAKKIAAMPRKKIADHIALQETSSIPVILAALVSYSMQSRTQAARELALLCRGRRSEGRAAVTRARGAKRVALMLATQDPQEQEIACEALASVCTGSPENSAQVWEEEEFGKQLLNLLTVGQVRVRGAAAMALAAICQECDAACETLSQAEGMKGLLEAVRRGPDRIREGACLAIAAACTKADGARAIMNRGGVDLVAKAMGKGGMSVRSAAARAVQGMLQRAWEGRAGVLRQVVEAGGFLLICALVRAGAATRAAAAEWACARSAAAAAAQGCRVDPRVAGELGRGGFVSLGLHLCLVSEPVNKVVRALAVRGAGVIETHRLLKAVRPVVRRDGGPEALRELLDPDGDGYVLESDWFAAQQSILETLEGMLDSDLQVSSEDTCSDLAREETRLALLLKRCVVRPQAIQISALGVLRRVCQHKAHGPVAADTLATLGAVKSLMDLIKADPLSSVHSRGLELLLEASKASEKLRRTADQAGVITVLKSVQHRAQEEMRAASEHAETQEATASQEDLAVDVLGACERCLAFYMRQEAGLLYTMQAGEVGAQEKAAAAIWHMSANRPSVRGAILGKKGIVETVAWNGVSDGTCEETKLTFSNSETVVNRHHSKIARRSSLNVLRVLGQVPYETEIAEDKPVVRKIKTKSKLKRWMEYQSNPIHTLPYKPKTRASIEGWQGF